MRKLTLVVLMLCSALGWAGTCGTGYSNSDKLILQKAVNSDLTNYPYSWLGTNQHWRTVANGGLIQNLANNPRSISGPADFIICDAASAGNAIKFYIPYYVPTTGKLQLIFLMSTLHTATNDAVWVFYNNAAVVTSQQDYSLLSTAGIVEWCHFPDGSSLNVNCDVLNGTATGSSVVANSGQVDGGVQLTRTDNDYITLSGTASPGGSTMSVEAWVNAPGGVVGFPRIASNLDASSNNGFLMYLNNGGGMSFFMNGSVLFNGGCCLYANVWMYLAETNDGSGSAGYLNGLPYTTGAAGTLGTPAQNLLIGKNISDGAAGFTGGIDELRISNVKRSADWIATNYKVELYPNAMQIYSTTGATTPEIIQHTSCASFDGSVAANCLLPLEVTAGNYEIPMLAEQDSLHCDAGVTTARGVTMTLRVNDDYTGTLHHYYTCGFTGQVVSGGAETVFIPSGNGAGIVYEVKNVSPSSIATATSGRTSSPPADMSATSPGNNSFLTCVTRGPATTGNSNGYSAQLSPASGSQTNIDHPSQAYSPYAIVGTGTIHCTITGNFTDSAVMMMLFNAPAGARKRLKTQIY